MADVFISYKRTDRPLVERLDTELRTMEYSVWFDARLELGGSEGFDIEIDREVSAAAAVVVCWTAEAVKSIYVRAEAKKALGRGVLIPIFVQQCDLPVPFNDIDTVDFSGWQGGTSEPCWQRLNKRINELREIQRRNRPAFEAASREAYNSLQDKLYPGVLSILARRIASVGSSRGTDSDALHFNSDIEAMLAWLDHVLTSETDAVDHLYWLNKYMPGGTNWHGEWEERIEKEWGAERRAQLDRMIETLGKLTKSASETRRLLGQSNPGWDHDTSDSKWLPFLNTLWSKRENS